METITKINIGNKFDANKLRYLADQGTLIQLEVSDLKSFNQNFSEVKHILRDSWINVKSMRGPETCSYYKTLFEDTVLIASKIEDAFSIELTSITTINGVHISELCDFYQIGTDINIIESRDPFNLALSISRLQITEGHSNLNMSLCWWQLESAWREKIVLDSLSSYIGEIEYVNYGNDVLDMLMGYGDKFNIILPE